MLEILLFPCNQSGRQEPNSSEEIAKFVTDKFGHVGTIMKKINVNGERAHPVYRWLKRRTASGRIQWNFVSSFVIGARGKKVKRLDMHPSKIAKTVKNALRASQKKRKDKGGL